MCFAVLAFIVIETMHTQISSLFLGKDGTALAYQVSGDYMRWLGYFFIFMGIKMATDGVLRGLGIMRPFFIANMVNLAIRLSVALICAPRFGIAFVWLAVPAGWLANFVLISYVALRKSWPGYFGLKFLFYQNRCALNSVNKRKKHRKFGAFFGRGFIINSMRKQSTGLFTVKSASTFEFRGSSPSALTTKQKRHPQVSFCFGRGRRT